MTRRISWLVVATTSAVVVSFVIPLCLLVRTLAEDRAMAAADQQTRNVAILLATVSDDAQLGSLLDRLVSTPETTTAVLTASGTQLGGGSDMTQDPDVTRALAGEAFRATDSDGGGSGRSSPSASCSPRCGSRRTAGPSAPSTSTSPGCAASSASPPRTRATW